MAQITIYTTEPCSFCTRVKGLLRSHGLEYSEVNLSNDQLLGGYNETLNAAQSGRLDELARA
jgi:glutaredoxin 3